MVKLLLSILPGAFHSPASYEKLIAAFISHKGMNKNKFSVDCVDYQRLKYLNENKMATMISYINESVKTIKYQYNHCKNHLDDDDDDNKCLIYLIGHSMGSRIAQMVINNLIKYENIKFCDIGGMIHISGNVFKNGQTYKELNDKHNNIINSKNNEFKETNSIYFFNYINDNECWMEIKRLEYVKYLFLNDINNYDTKTLQWFWNTLQPEITSNITFETYYDANIVNTKNIPNLYIHTMLDNCINIELQKEMCHEFGIKDTIFMNTGHNPFVSKPTILCDHIYKWIQKQTFIPKYKH